MEELVESQLIEPREVDCPPRTRPTYHCTQCDKVGHQPTISQSDAKIDTFHDDDARYGQVDSDKTQQKQRRRTY